MSMTIGVLVVPVEDDDAEGIAALTAHHRLSAPDAVVLHTAIMTSDALVTFDTKLARVARAVGFPVIDRAPADLEWDLPGVPLRGQASDAIQSAAVTTSACRGNTFSSSTRCTSGSPSEHASDSTVRP